MTKFAYYASNVTILTKAHCCSGGMDLVSWALRRRREQPGTVFYTLYLVTFDHSPLVQDVPGSPPGIQPPCSLVDICNVSEQSVSSICRLFGVLY
jgi:hypothetical protein